jgi:competence protein ComEA
MMRDVGRLALSLLKRRAKGVSMFHPNSKAALIAAVLVLLAGFVPAFAQTKGGAEKVNINTASAAELEKLPQIGPQIARRIVDFRKESGGFKRIEDLMKVKGIGEKTFDRLKDLITVGSEAASK